MQRCYLLEAIVSSENSDPFHSGNSEPSGEGRPHETRIPVGGAALYSREIGKGTAIIILHGGPDFDHSYLLPELAAMFPLIVAAANEITCNEPQSEIFLSLLHNVSVDPRYREWSLAILGVRDRRYSAEARFPAIVPARQQAGGSMGPYA